MSFLEPFSQKDLPLINAIIKRLIGCDISPEEVLLEIDDSHKRIMAESIITAPVVRVEPSNEKPVVCPLCGGKLFTMSVNKTKCTQVGGEYTKMRFCKNCDYKELT